MPSLSERLPALTDHLGFRDISWSVWLKHGGSGGLSSKLMG